MHFFQTSSCPCFGVEHLRAAAALRITSRTQKPLKKPQQQSVSYQQEAFIYHLLYLQYLSGPKHWATPTLSVLWRWGRKLLFCVSWLHHFNALSASGSPWAPHFTLSVFSACSSTISWFRLWGNLQIRQMSSLYEDKECCELGLPGELTQVNSEELEFDYLFNYEPPESDFPSGDLKGLFLLSLLLLSCVSVCVCVNVWKRLVMINCSANCAKVLWAEHVGNVMHFRFGIFSP